MERDNIKIENKESENQKKNDVSNEKKEEISFEKEKESRPWEKNKERDEKLRKEIESDANKSMKIEQDTMKSVSNKFVETLANFELEKKNDLKNILIRNAEEWAVDNVQGNPPTGEAAIHTLKSFSDPDKYNKIYLESIKEVIENNKEREKRINDLEALIEAYFRTYSNGEVPFEARRAAFLELNKIGEKDYSSFKLRANLFEKMTGRNFEKEYNVILNSKEFNEKNFENYKIQINKDVKEFVKKNLNNENFRAYAKKGFSANAIYKAKELGFIDKEIDLKKRNWYNFYEWFRSESIVKYENKDISRSDLEKIINEKWDKKIDTIMQKEAILNDLKISKIFNELDINFTGERDNTMEKMKEQLENDLFARQLKTEKDTEKVVEKYDKKGEKFNVKEFVLKTAKLQRELHGDFKNNVEDIRDFINNYGFKFSEKDILEWDQVKKKKFIKAAKKKNAMMRYIMEMILNLEG